MTDDPDEIDDGPPDHYPVECARCGKAGTSETFYIGDRQSQDVDNEMDASRIRVRAERRLGEILKKMAENGERKAAGRPDENGSAARLLDLGIPKDRASRAMQLAEVPQEQGDEWECPACWERCEAQESRPR
jgi:hypothetical protein